VLIFLGGIHYYNVVTAYTGKLAEKAVRKELSFARVPICGYYQLDMGDLLEDSVVKILTLK